jgi:hypothetical protein
MIRETQITVGRSFTVLAEFDGAGLDFQFTRGRLQNQLASIVLVPKHEGRDYSGSRKGTVPTFLVALVHHTRLRLSTVCVRTWAP